MARLRRLQGNYKEAQEIIVAAARQRPEDVRFGLEGARIALEAHDLVAAETAINRWLGKGMATFELNLLEGRLAFQRGEYAKAAAYLQNAQAMPQGDGEATVFFGITLARLGRYDEAGPLLLDTLPHPTWSGWGWLYLGELRRLQGRFDDAFANFPKALREFKAQTGPRWRFSTLYAEWARTFAARYGWDHPRVLASLETGRDDGDADDPELNMAFAEYFLKRKKSDTEAAIRHLNKVVQVASYRCDALAQLGSLPGVDERRRTELKELQSLKCR
jgi:tetratricopeptide (TPR) repeat protein